MDCNIEPAPLHQSGQAASDPAKRRKTPQNAAQNGHAATPDANAVQVLAAPKMMMQRFYAVATLAPKDGGKLDKAPRTPQTLKHAQTDDLDTLGTYTEAMAAVASGRAQACGPVLKRDGVICLDLDLAFNPDTGKITNGAADVLRRFNGALVTISASGRGLHVWIKAKAPFSGACETYHHDGQKVEILAEKFVVENWQPFGEAGEIHQFGSELKTLYSELKPTPQPKPTPTLYKAPNGPAIARNGHTGSDGAAYVLKALENARGKMSTAADGTKHGLRVKLARTLGGWVHTGHIKEAEIMDALAANFGPNEANARKAIADGIEYGKAAPRDVPPPKTRRNEGIVGFVSDSKQEIENFLAESFQQKPKPLSVDLLPVPALSEEMLPERLMRWIADIAERMKVPKEYPAMTAVVCLSAIIGRQVAIRPKRYDDWNCVCNLWGGLVGLPGELKTPAAEEALKPLHRLAAEAREKHAEQMKVFCGDVLLAQAEAKASKSKLEKAVRDNKHTREQLKEMAQASAIEEETAAPACKRYIVNDATIEALCVVLKENPNGVLSLRDELAGFLRNLEKQGHEGDRAFYLEAWGGAGNFTVDRIGRGTDIFLPSVCVSLFGTIQPGVLARYIRSATNGEGADGLIQRFQLMVYPDPVPYKYVDRYPHAAAKNQAFAIFQALQNLDISALGAQVEADEKNAIPFLRFAPDAQKFFDEWLCDLESQKLGGKDSPVIESHLSKYRSLMPSLALIFHLVDTVDTGNSGAVSLESAMRAAAWCDFLEAHARRIYQSAFEGDTEPALRLAERIKQTLPKPFPNPFTPRDVVRKGWAGLSSAEDVERALGLLEEKNWVQSVEITQPDGGRPSRKFYINPLVLGGDAA